MKRVLLLGDSIRIGYCVRVAALLEGRAEVLWLNENCRFAHYMLAAMISRAAAMEIPDEAYSDAVHFKPEGYQVLAEAVVRSVEKYIE